MAEDIIGTVLALAATGTVFRAPVAWVSHREVRP
jgi:hypothetical protein